MNAATADLRLNCRDGGRVYAAQSPATVTVPTRGAQRFCLEVVVK